MLGYVRADALELRMREQQYYRAIYCGLCHRMGKCTGQCSRMTLSYDFVFLAALRLSLAGQAPEIRKQRCVRHPFRARPTLAPCESLDFCADASAILCYHKLRDDLADERGMKRLRAAILRPFFGSAYRRARKRRPALDGVIGERLGALSAIEASPAGSSADALAECFGEMMAAVFSEGLSDHDARLARAIGRSVGRWIYLADAADDFCQDLRRDRFNPYRVTFGDRPSDTDWESVRLAMTAHLYEAERAFLLIDSYPAPELREILANILYLGLPDTAARVTKQDGKTQRKASPHENTV